MPQVQSQNASRTNAQHPDFSGLRAPNSTVARFFWRCKIWVDATFSTALLEPWESLVLLFFFLIFMLLLIGGIYHYLPSQVAFLAKRAQYYLLGADSNGAEAGTTSHTIDL